MTDAHFKIQDQYYYIGSDYKTFAFIQFPKNTEEKKKSNGLHVFFTNEKDELTTEECVLFNYSSYFEDESKTNKQYVFNFLINKDNGLNFEYIAEAFSDFLQKIKCINPIFSSFLFVKHYIEDIMNKEEVEITNDPSLQINSKPFPYEKNKMYCTTILNLLYFVFRAHDDPNCLSGDLKYFRENLKKFILIIALICKDEIKTIDNNLANKFITGSFMKFDSNTKSLLTVVYYLLTAQISIGDTKKNLVVFNSPDDVKVFIKRILPKEINQNNYWLLLSFMLVCNPYEMLDDENDYKFPDEVEEKVLNPILQIYPKGYREEKTKGWLGGEKIKKIERILFINHFDEYKKMLKNFKEYLETIFYDKFPDSIEQIDKLEIIQKELKLIYINLTNVLDKIDRYAYEDIRKSALSVDKLYNKIFARLGKKNIKKKLLFWTYLNSEDLSHEDLSTRKSIIDCISRRME